MYYCSRCGTPLQPGDRFCPRCGAPAADAPGQPARPKGHAVGIAAAMGAMVLLLLAAAVWSQRDSFADLFDPAPTPWPGQQEDSERVNRPSTDAAGSPVVPLDETAPEQDMARALLAEAGEEAFLALYGDEPLSRAGAKELFCNLEAGGYPSALDKAMEVNAETVGTLSRWGGYLLGRPLMAGNCGFVLGMFYTVSGDTLPLQIEYDTVLIGLLWTGSRWRVDGSGQVEQRWQAQPMICADARQSPALQRAWEDGRMLAAFAQGLPVLRPVLPGTYDALPIAVYENEEGLVCVEFWAFNGTDTPLDADRLQEVSLREPGGTTCFALYDLPIEPLHLEPGEGELVTISLPAGALKYDPHFFSELTCAVWFEY